MPIYPIPDVGENYEDVYSKLLKTVFKFKSMVDSLYAHFNSSSILDINSYRVRCLKKILKEMETFCFIVSKHEDLCSANIMTRCIVDNTAAFLLIYDNDDEEMVLLRHYLALLNGLEARGKALKSVDGEQISCAEKDKEAILKMNSFTTERNKSAEETCCANIRKLKLYSSNKEQLETLIKYRNWKFKCLGEKGHGMQWCEMYSQTKVAPSMLTEYLSQDVHGLSFSVENIEAEPKAFVGGIDQVGYCCQLLGAFICNRLKHLNTQEVKATYQSILNEAKEQIKPPYPVITLCGSTRFKDQFLEAQKRLTLEGNIVISVGLFGHSGDDEVWTEGTKEMLDDMHKRKIDMADAIYVINVGGYIGSSTRSEIEYASKNGKEIIYLEP